jgi:hypothetical protein
VTDKIRGHGKAGEEAYHSRLGVAYGSGGGCGVRQNLSIRLPHVSNGRDTAQWIWRGVAGCWPTCGYRSRRGSPNVSGPPVAQVQDGDYRSPWIGTGRMTPNRCRLAV